MEPEYTDRSEWNEQQYYASMFFGLTARCRAAQSILNILDWKNAVETKISLVIGIADDTETEELKRIRKKLNELYSSYLSVNPKHRNSLKSRELLSELNEELFESEARIDKITNIHMPFLRFKEKYDPDDW